jgi:hypothetical protein
MNYFRLINIKYCFFICIVTLFLECFCFKLMQNAFLVLIYFVVNFLVFYIEILIETDLLTI